MRENKGYSAYNLGNGSGLSVLDVIKGCERVIGAPINFDVEGRRAGDPAVLVADSKKAIDVLGWTPKFDDLDTILSSAWRWHQEHG